MTREELDDAIARYETQKVLGQDPEIYEETE